MGKQYYLRCFFEEINGDHYYFDVLNNNSNFLENFRSIMLELQKNKLSFSKNKKFSKFLRVEFIKDYQTILIIKSFEELIDKNRICLEYIESIVWEKLSREELSFYIINNFAKISLLADSEMKQKMINVSKHVNLNNDHMKPYKHFHVVVNNLKDASDSELVRKSKYITPIKYRGYK